MNIPFIAANWKMNTTVAEAEKLVGTLLGPLSSIDGIEKVLCPPFVSLSLIKTILQGSNIKLGAQNMYFEAEGAYTGEISPLMLSELCEYVILGHSERRRYFKENDNMINKKIRAALENKLKPILCVGEILEENMSGKTEKVIRRQLTGDLTGVEATHNIVIAYEPVWAIGTGRASSGEQAVTTIKFIRNVITELWNKDIALNLRILYGGSVNSSNVTEFVSHPEIDGALVGGASLKTDEFVDIISQTAFIKKQAFRNN